MTEDSAHAVFGRNVRPVISRTWLPVDPTGDAIPAGSFTSGAQAIPITLC
jgi:hypothetical protein